MPGNDLKPDGDVGAAVRDRLLDASVQAFAAFGFEGASLRMIAQKAGVAFQLITYYFGSKEALWIATVDHLFEARIKAAKAKFNPTKEFEPQLKDWLQTAMRFAIEAPELRRIICQEYLAGSDRYANYLRIRSREATPYFAYFFDHAQKQEVPPCLSTNEMLLILRGMMVLASVAPDEITSVIGGRPNSQRTLGVLTELIANLFIKGRGAASLNQPNT